MRISTNRFFIVLCFVALGFSSAANALNETYKLYEKNGDYYLKAEPTWVPISGEIFIIIPVFEEGEIIKLVQSGDTWDVQNISHNEFASVNPSFINFSSFTYSDVNGDGLDDIYLTYYNNTYEQVQLYALSDGTSFTAQPLTRRVIFIHTDLLGSPVAETDVHGETL